MALKAYRERAEEILDRHFCAMEETQHAQELELAALKAENGKLRDMLGTNRPDQQVQQNVLFQTMGPAGANARRKDARKKANRDDDDDKRTANTRRGRKNTEQQPGGSWQQFVAWVPNGAALQNPEPWKPLPQATLQIGDQQRLQIGDQQRGPGGRDMQKKKSLTFASTDALDEKGFAGVLPGVVDEGSPRRGKRENDDNDSENSEETQQTREEKFQLLAVWMKNARDKMKIRHSRTSDSDNESMPSCKTDPGEIYSKSKPFFIIDPDGTTRIAWDLCSLFMVVYDMIMIPMQAFPLQDHIFLQMMDWTTRLFWTLDMGWSCCTGTVLEDGTVEFNPKSIVKRYLKSWFGLDLFIVGSDWSGLLFESGGMGISRLARVSRVARVVRLLRLVRMQEVISNITERIQSENVGTVIFIFKMLIFLLAVCHAMACGWFGISDSSTEVQTWVHKYGYDEEDVGVQYLVSLHWSLCLFAGGMEEVLPRNALERFYAITAWIFAFMAGLVMLSVLTSSLTQQYIIGGSGARQISTLRKYLNQNKLSKNLTKRLVRNAKHAISGDLTPDTVDLLHVVSEPLKIEMHYEMYAQILKYHPFFAEWPDEWNQVMRRICHEATSMLLLAVGDIVFARDEDPVEPKMYFVVAGTLEYEDIYGDAWIVREKSWLAEAALWTTWKHRGTLTATCDVKLALLDSVAFQEICAQHMKKHRSPNFSPKLYAEKYVEELNTSEFGSDISGGETQKQTNQSNQ